MRHEKLSIEYHPPLNMPEAHVEWDHRYSDVLRRLLVDVGQLQPRMVLLLPSFERLLGRVGRILVLLVGEKFIK